MRRPDLDPSVRHQGRKSEWKPGRISCRTKMNEISIHDNIVTGYTVSCTERRLTIHTAFREAQPNERTDVVFHEVETYHFPREDMSTILFGIAECPIEQILEEFSLEFESGKEFAWPGFWNKSPEACIKHYSERNCRAWWISSSIGMEGFVIAQSMELTRV